MVSRDEILDDVPNLGDWAGLDEWFTKGREALSRLRASPELEATLQPIEVGAAAELPHSPFGRYANVLWRKLVLGAFLADWACYPVPVDQVGFERLAYVMHVFPAGFRTWWAKCPDAGWLPVGYTGWHPIPQSMFDVLTSHGATLRDRSILPLARIDPEHGSFVYVFNYSMVAPLRRTICSKRLVQALAADLQGVRLRGLASITVSADGTRIAERLGMRRVGSLAVDGSEEWIYAARFNGHDEPPG